MDFEKLKAKILALYASLNTHMVGGIGLGTAMLSLGAMVGQHYLDPHLAFNPTLQWTFDYFAQQIAAPLTATAVYAAYLGRPKMPGVKPNDAGTAKPSPDSTGSGTPQ